MPPPPEKTYCERPIQQAQERSGQELTIDFIAHLFNTHYFEEKKKNMKCALMLA